MIRLRALGWGHERCVAPMQACADLWTKQRPGVEIVWEYRSLEAFGDQPLEAIAPEYDLLVIDHPFCGTAEATATLVAIDGLLAPDELTSLALDAVGPSHRSYTFHGRQWALATDAACQVAAVRDDLLGDAAAPRSWDDVLELARSRPGSVALPLSPTQSLCAFMTLCANAGAPIAEEAGRLVEPEIGRAAVAVLEELGRLGPQEALRWQPPDILDRLTSTDDLVYVPLAFGFVTFARPDRVERPCRFLGIPSAGRGPVGALLGGAGLAVSAASAHPREAAAFAAFASHADTQRTIVGPAGGQPGSASAWDDRDLDRAAGGFFSGTRKTIEGAWVRPRDAWWPDFQLHGGHRLHRGITTGEQPSAVLASLESLYRDCIRRPT